eukprot:56362-Hanusia_phi.AAC.1
MRFPSDETDSKLLLVATLYCSHAPTSVHPSKVPASPTTTATFGKNEVVTAWRLADEGICCVYQDPFHLPMSPSVPTAHTALPSTTEIEWMVKAGSSDMFLTAREAKDTSRTLPLSPPTYSFLDRSSASIHNRSKSPWIDTITSHDSELLFHRASFPPRALAK